MKKAKRGPVSAVCSILGTVLLILLVAVCVPLTVPKMFGYHVYTVISGSMEPAIPTGSLVYIQSGEPEDAEEGDVIAFYGTDNEGSIITHRVVTNSTIGEQIITKGDANETNDMNPVPYANYIGKVVKSIPKVGALAQTLSTTAGKVAAASLIGIAVVLEIIGALTDKRRGNE